MTKVTTNFSQETIYIGLDIHKRSWNAAFYLNDQYLCNVHQPPSAQALYKYLHSQLKGIYIPCVQQEADRSLVRQSRKFLILFLRGIAENPSLISCFRKKIRMNDIECPYT